MKHVAPLLVITLAFASTGYALLPNPDTKDEDVSIECLPKKTILENGCARFSLKDDECKKTPGTFASIEGSCFYDMNDSKSILIPELLDQNVKSFNQEILKSYSLDDIARNLMYRIYKIRDLPQIDDSNFLNSAYPFYHRLDLQIAFDEQFFDSIKKNGFQNQHVVGHSKGSMDVALRLRTEETMVGLSFLASYESMALKNLLPKYLYAPPSLNQTGLFAHAYQSGYGNIFAILKDEVRNRMTISPGDSLVQGGNRCYTMKGNIRPEFSSGNRYFEGQIWGTLNFSHVKYFMVNCPNHGDAIDITARKISAESNLPVYSCKKLSINGGTYYRPDKLLYGTAYVEEFSPNYCLTRLNATTPEELNQELSGLTAATRESRLKGLIAAKGKSKCEQKVLSYLSLWSRLKNASGHELLRLSLDSNDPNILVRSLEELAKESDRYRTLSYQLEMYAINETELSRRVFYQMLSTLASKATDAALAQKWVQNLAELSRKQ